MKIVSGKWDTTCKIEQDKRGGKGRLRSNNTSHMTRKTEQMAEEKKETETKSRSF